MSKSDIEPITDELADALLSFVGREGALDENMLEGAWIIALANDGRAVLLRDEVLEHSSAARDTPLLRRILSDVPSLPEGLQKIHGSRLMTLLTANPEAAASLLRGFDDAVSERIIAATQKPLVDRAQSLAANQGDDEDSEAYERRQEAAEELFTAVNETLGGLMEQRAIVQAELFFMAMLGSRAIRNRNVIEQQLASLAPLRRADLTSQCLEIASLRQASLALPWFEALDPDLAWTIDDGQGLMAAARAFGEGVAKDQAGEVDVEVAASELARLRGKNAWPEKLSLDELIVDPSELPYTQFEARLDLVQPLLDIDLVAPADVASARAAAVAAELRREHHPEVDNDDAPRFIVETLRGVLGSVETSVLEDTREASDGADWLPVLERNRLHLMFDVAAKDRQLAVEDPVDAELVVSLISAHDQALDHEVAEWIARDPGNTAIQQIIEAYAGRRPEPLLAALRQVSAQADPQRRLALCEPFFDERPDKLLDALEFQNADQSATAELLIGRYAKVSNNHGREQILLLWGALRPTEAEPRRRLIREVMIPMATRNREALELVLREINLAREPPRTKKVLRDALWEGGEKFNRQKQVRAKLEDLGWSRRTGKLRRRDIDVN